MGPLTATSRVEGWEVLLATLVEEGRNRPFEWGVHDCATWAFDVRRALTDGEDVAALWRGKYTSAAGAALVLRRLGWRSLESGGRALMGAPLPSVRMCQRGDIVLMGEGFGVVIGAQAVGLSPDGMAAASVLNCTCGWRV